MSGWISKAANVFRRDEHDAPQPFETVCECGQVHTGMRRGRFQHLVCKSCGASLFILPRDVYPPPHVPKSASPPPPPPPEEVQENESVFQPAPTAPGSEPRKRDSNRNRSPRTSPETSPDGAPSLPPRQKTKRERQREHRRQQRERQRNKPAPAEPPVPAGPGMGQRLGDYFRGVTRGFFSLFTPFRIILLLILGLGISTALWSIQQNRRAHAVITAKEQGELGLKAIGERNWTAARNAFEQATWAVDLLGRDDLEANRYRQFFRETRAMTRMAGDSLFEMLDHAIDVTDHEGDEAWQREFRIRYRDKWMVIDGPVRLETVSPPMPADPGGDEAQPQQARPQRRQGDLIERRYELRFPWRPTQAAGVRVVVDFPVFENLVSPEREAVVIFAGELQECRLSEDRSEWVVRFNSETGFLWGHQVTYDALGFQSDPHRPDVEVLNRLEGQLKLMGVVP
jgi:hypothetical protein